MSLLSHHPYSKKAKKYAEKAHLPWQIETCRGVSLFRDATPSAGLLRAKQPGENGSCAKCVGQHLCNHPGAGQKQSYAQIFGYINKPEVSTRHTGQHNTETAIKHWCKNQTVEHPTGAWGEETLISITYTTTGHFLLTWDHLKRWIFKP